MGLGVVIEYVSHAYRQTYLTKRGAIHSYRLNSESGLLLMGLAKFVCGISVLLGSTQSIPATS
jgi:hypothetical protein